MSKFQKRHYDEIARVLGDCHDWAHTRQIENNRMIATAAVGKLAFALMEMFAEDNPGFSRDRFATTIYNRSVARQKARQADRAA